MKKLLIAILVISVAISSVIASKEDTNKDLEEKLKLVEQKVLDETAFGRQMRDFMEKRNTRYLFDPSLPYQARYSMANDTVHFNTNWDPSLETWKKELLIGRPIDTMLNLHEELHRAQVSHSERGRFFQFFRDNGQIKENADFEVKSKLHTIFLL